MAAEAIGRIMNDGPQQRDRRQEGAGYDLSQQTEDCAGRCPRQRELRRVDARLLEFLFKAGDARLNRFDTFRSTSAIERIAFEEPLSQLKRSRQTLFFIGLAEFFSGKNFLGSSD